MVQLAQKSIAIQVNKSMKSNHALIVRLKVLPLGTPIVYIALINYKCQKHFLQEIGSFKVS